MKNTWFLRLRVRIRKLRRRTWKKYVEGQDNLNEWRQLGFDIFKIALLDEGNIRYHDAPNGSHTSSIKYIISKEYLQGMKDVNTFIIFDSGLDSDGKMTVVNHEFKYDFDFPPATSNLMNEMFDDAVRKDRKKMREEIMSNITTSLVTVLTALKMKMLETKQRNQELKRELNEKRKVQPVPTTFQNG